MVPNLRLGILLLNSSMRPSDCSERLWEMSCEGDDDATRIPTMWRIVLTMPLNRDMDKEVFTRSTHSIPSDGSGRLDSPILMDDGCLYLDLNPQTRTKIAKLTSSLERKLCVGLLLPAKTHQVVLYFTKTETRKECMAMINQSVIELINKQSMLQSRLNRWFSSAS